MADKALPSPELLRQLLSYDPDTGLLMWLRRPVEMFASGGRLPTLSAATWNSKFADKTAFTAKNANGYHVGIVFYQLIFAHRAIWAMSHGAWPDQYIDHINGVRTDNRIANLRSVTRQENMRNAARPKRNTSGVIGVYLDKTCGKWIASIKVDSRQIHLGRFASFNDAVVARKAAEVEWGFHANHGRDPVINAG